MKFMVEYRLKPGSKDKVIEAFEAVGPNRNPGVRLLNAWIGTRSDVIYVLSESDDESLVAAVAQNWCAYGESQVTPVVDLEQF